MRLPSAGRPHLTYCTNIHPGETWAEVRENLARYVVAVKAQVAPARPFGVGLRLSARAAESLAVPGELAALRDFLDAHGLYLFTINGFPYGAFHGVRVKEAVYLPDWLDDARLAYTDRLATLLAALLPPADDAEGSVSTLPAAHALEGSVSTVPGAFKARVTGERDVAAMAERMLRHVATLHRIHEETGKRIALALEPEPCCFLETIGETVAFFERHLFARTAVACLAALTGLGAGASEVCLRRHLGVCFDACHMAVEFEEPAAALRVLAAAGIRIAKIQISAGLKVHLGGGRDRDAETLAALRPFAEGVYLHQVVERSGDGLRRFLDLPAALEAAGAGLEAGVGAAGDREWRIHFHVPLDRERLGIFLSTQDYLRELLAILRREPHTPHLEVETYAWEVLPEEHRSEDIVTAVAREIRWVEERMTADNAFKTLTPLRSGATLGPMHVQQAPFLSREDRLAVDRFLAGARRHFEDRLLRVVLFGSKARGDSHAESDLDLLVVLRDDGGVDWRDARAVSFLAADVGLETGVDVAAKCVSSERFDREATEPVGFASRVSREGVTLWQAS